MEERRKVQRHRVLKAGSIGFNRAAGIDCRIRNMSPAGACLDVASPFGIPDDFVLVVESDHLRQPCHVIWRSGNRMGVAFRADEQPVPPQAA
jgi:PilZ domain